jgi:hypothetical protein
MPVVPTISIVLGNIRIGTADSWTEARQLLREDIEGSYPMFGGDLARQHYAYERDMLTTEPVNGLLMTSGTWAWASTMRYAQEGMHGLSAGSLADIRDYNHGSLGWWTVSVKCKIISVTGHSVTARITGESVQFRRGQTVTIPSTYFARRGGAL